MVIKATYESTAARMHGILQKAKSYCDEVTMLVGPKSSEMEDLHAFVPQLEDCISDAANAVLSQGAVADWLHLSQALVTYRVKVTTLVSEMTECVACIKGLPVMDSTDPYGANYIEANLKRLEEYPFELACRAMTSAEALHIFNSLFSWWKQALNQIDQILSQHYRQLSLKPKSWFPSPEEKEEQKFCQKYAENIRDCLVDSLTATEAVILEIGEILHRRQIFRANGLPGLPPSSGLPALPMVPELHARTVLPAIEQNSSLPALPIMSSSSMLSSTPPRSGTRHSLNVSPTVQEINHLLPSSSSSSSSTSLLQGPATSSTAVASNSATRSANQAELDDPTAKRRRLDETTPP